ncbi:MAG: SufD family Fe-S cluster assembly protein [Candidatus Peregrinibacteria bacterium]|nr:SufD family Fe-S cluster assembly protein [Candidatus Peregrinibacteria bacterium]
MNHFTLPFIIESDAKNYVLSKCYEEKAETYLLKVEAGTILESPIWVKIRPTEDTLDFTLKVEIGQDSSASIIEDWSLEVKSDDIRYKNLIRCAPNSELKYVILNHTANDTRIVESRNSEIDASAKCHIYSYHFGSKKVDSRIQQKTIGQGAEIFTDIVAKTGAKQDLNFNCEHLYAAREGSGDIGMKGIAEEKAMLNFDGIINIAQNGGGSSGFLNQETLNLSPNTVVKATPGLKIDTNDVKAGHGASVRNLNDEDLYYFGARGISRDEAKKLLIAGFLGAEVKKIENLKPAYDTIKGLI